MCGSRPGRVQDLSASAANSISAEVAENESATENSYTLSGVWNCRLMQLDSSTSNVRVGVVSRICLSDRLSFEPDRFLNLTDAGLCGDLGARLTVQGVEVRI